MNFEKEFRVLPNQRLRFLKYKSKKNHSYNTSIIINTERNIELEIVNKVINILMGRHEVLRSLFYYQDNDVYQRVYCPAKFKSRLQFQDISVTKDKEKLLEDFSNYIFDLEKEPAFKCLLAKYTDKNYIFIMVLDHIIYDTPSINIIEKELNLLYEGFVSGITPPLKAKRVHFSNFVEHYYQQYHGKQLKFHFEYFKRLFNGSKLISHRLRIKEHYLQKSIAKKDSNRYNQKKKTEVKSFNNFNGYCFYVPNNISTEITKVLKILKITPSVFLLANFCSFLQKVNYQDDIVIDIPISLRDNKKFSEVVGWLSSALLIRINNKNINFDELILKCRNILYEAFEHRYYQKYFAHFGDSDNHMSYTSCQLNIIDNLKMRVSSFDSFQFQSKAIIFDFGFHIEMFMNGYRVSCKFNDKIFKKLNFPLLCEEFIEELRCQTQQLKTSLDYR